MREYILKKLVLALVISLLSSNAVAVWEYMSSSPNNTDNIYIDHATIRKSGNLAKMWFLIDYKATQTVGEYSFLSEMRQLEFDCKTEKTRVTATAFNKENMGRGATVLYDGDVQGKWNILPPGSVGEQQLKIACGEEHILRPHTASGNVEWVKFGEAGGAAVFYFDPMAIQKKGEYRIVWILIDFMPLPAVSESGVFSMQIRREYDCKKEKSRDLAMFLHSDSMGLGDILESSDDARFLGTTTPIKLYKPGTEDNMFNILCEKRG